MAIPPQVAFKGEWPYEDMEPRYKHDSACCTFIGQEIQAPVKDGKTWKVEVADIYTCGEFGKYNFTIMLRHSDEPSDYESGGMGSPNLRTWQVAVLSALAAGLIEMPKPHYREIVQPV